MNQKQHDIGVFILRFGLGAMFIYHGLPKLLAGPEMWTKLGGAMGLLGISFAPAFWGILAALAELLGGILIMLGLLIKPACIGLVFVMFVAAYMHLASGHGLAGAAHAIEDGIAFLGLFFLDPGKYRVAYRP